MRIVFLFLFGFLFLPSVLASGSILLTTGETLTLSAESRLFDPIDFTWFVKKNNTIIDTLSGENLVYTFSDSGDFTVDLFITGEFDTQEQTTMTVHVSSPPQENTSLHAVLHTLPSPSETGVIEVPVAHPQVRFLAQESVGDIVEYHFDTDISVDSDGDGNPVNDIDNQSHPSRTTGQVFPFVFQNTSDDITARMTIVGKNGMKSSVDIFIRFVQKFDTEPLLAKLHSLPPASPSGEIVLSTDVSQVIFYFGDSTGKIIQYRFDTDISIDSDGDGNPANDIDNQSHPSFTTPIPFVWQVPEDVSAGQKRTVQFIAVSSEGKGSRIRKTISFLTPDVSSADGQSREVPDVSDNKSDNGIDIQNAEINPKILTDTELVLTGEKIEFHILGVPSGAKYEWDFNGNGNPDYTGTETRVLHEFDSSGENTVEVTISLDGRTFTKKHHVRVQDPVPDLPPLDPKIALSSEKNILTVLAEIPESSDGLTYFWDFGDGETSTDQSPQHTYKKAGDYDVFLTITDAEGVEYTATDIFSLPQEDMPSEDIDLPSSSPVFSLSETEDGGFQFNIDSASESSDGLTYFWDFGDGETSTDSAPQHTYEKAGDYNILLTVTDTEGSVVLQSSQTHTFAPKNTPPKNTETEDISTGDHSPENKGEKESDTPADSSDPEEDTEKTSSGFSWWKIFFVFFLLLFGILGMVLFFRKIESPDLTFGEIIHEEQEKWRQKWEQRQQKKQERALPAQKTVSEAPLFITPTQEKTSSPEGKTPDFVPPPTTEVSPSPFSGVTQESDSNLPTHSDTKKTEEKDSSISALLEDSSLLDADEPLPDWMEPLPENMEESALQVSSIPTQKTVSESPEPKEKKILPNKQKNNNEGGGEQDKHQPQERQKKAPQDPPVASNTLHTPNSPAPQKSSEAKSSPSASLLLTKEETGKTLPSDTAPILQKSSSEKKSPPPPPKNPLPTKEKNTPKKHMPKNTNYPPKVPKKSDQKNTSQKNSTPPKTQKQKTSPAPQPLATERKNKEEKNIPSSIPKKNPITPSNPSPQMLSSEKQAPESPTLPPKIKPKKQPESTLVHISKERVSSEEEGKITPAPPQKEVSVDISGTANIPRPPSHVPPHQEQVSLEGHASAKTSHTEFLDGEVILPSREP